MRVCLIQFGVAVFLHLDIGSDPFTVLTQGIAKQTHSTPGMANRIITIVMCLVMLVWDRKYIKVGTIVLIICAGSMINGFLFLLKGVQVSILPLVVKCILFFAATISIATSIPLIKLADVGVAPNDSIYFALQDHLSCGNWTNGRFSLSTCGIFDKESYADSRFKIN